MDDSDTTIIGSSLISLCLFAESMKLLPAVTLIQNGTLRCDQKLREVYKENKNAYAMIFQAQFSKKCKNQSAYLFLNPSIFFILLFKKLVCMCMCIYFPCISNSIQIRFLFTFVFTFSYACRPFTQMLYKKWMRKEDHSLNRMWLKSSRNIFIFTIPWFY